MNNVFVYGTLKKGFVNHDEQRLSACYCGDCQTLHPYPLVIANDYYSPVLINEKGRGVRVMGELYLVDKTVLSFLDQIEGVGMPGGYSRQRLVVVDKTGEIINAYVYTKDRSALSVIHYGPLSSYQIDLCDNTYIPASNRS